MSRRPIPPAATLARLALLALALATSSTLGAADTLRLPAGPSPAPDTTLWKTPNDSPRPAPRDGQSVMARGDRFELVGQGAAVPLFFRGVNFGAAPPGRFPGEFAIAYEDYRRWLRFARELHANAIRVYALHPPDFYRALRAENEAHPESPIWLFQEVWTELPETNDFWTSSYRRAFEREIRMTIDAVHGNAGVKARAGHASGRYDADVSRWLAGWLLGREWEPYAVRETERLHPDSTRFEGEFFRVEGGTPMECWLAHACEVAARYEWGNYGIARAVAFVNWPTLDPMRHPTEGEPGGVEAEHDEDAYSIDPTRIRPRGEISVKAGFLGYFADYHAYPYYPDFMNLDPGYGAFRDRHGACSYAGYLADLKAHTRGIPLLIGEYGVPASRAVAHLQRQGIHHGGASEKEQGRRDVRLLEDISGSGASGSLLFALFDEWFKVNWLARKTEQPRDRDPLWHNLLDPEECYGLIGFDPPSAIHVDGDLSDWAGIAPYARADSAEGAATGQKGILRALYATSDQARFYLRVDLGPSARQRGARSIGIAFDVLDPERGDRRLPPPLRATWSRGAERVLLLEPGRRRAELFADDATRYSEYAQRRAADTYEYLLGPYRPVANEDGRYLPMLVETNRERVSRDGRVYPAQIVDTGRLGYGREPKARSAWPSAAPTRAYDPHAEWYVDDAGRSIEIAIPWGLLGVGDPSSRAVIDDRDGTPEIETTRTAGIALLAWAMTTPGARADSLGPAEPSTRAPSAADIEFLGPGGTVQTVEKQWLTISSPADRLVVWNAWEVPITQEHVKSSAQFVREAFEGMEARENKKTPSLDARR